MQPHQSYRCVAFLLALLLTFSGFAATFTVTTTADSGTGSLRQAILDANSNPGADTINFSVGTGVQTITASTVLPTITDPVEINGATQPGFAGAPLIELYGNLNRAFDGLMLNTSNCTVRSFVIRGFGNTSSSRRSGILITNFGGHTIVGCYLGTTAAGTVSSRNSQDGIQIIDSTDNRIGGTNANEANLISGNSRYDIEILGSGSTGNVVLATIIGLDATGTSAVANGSGGILISNASGNCVGGATAAARNVIAGNSGDHVAITGTSAAGNSVLGNYLGIRVNGTALTGTPSNQRGVKIDGAPGNIVGGVASGAGNVLSGNSQDVTVLNAGASHNVIQGNFIGLSPLK